MREAIEQTTVSPGFSFGVFLGSLFLLLAIMSYQVTDRVTGHTVFGTVVFRLLSPFQLIVHGGISGTVDTFKTYFNLIDTNRENARLRKELSELKIKFATVSQQSIENERLRKILELQQRTAYGLVVGEVIGRDAKALISDTLIVNRGSRQGLKREMPVVTPDGIVGMTVLVDLLTSKVQLITDASASFGAMLQNNRIAGILSGMGGGRCILRYLPVNSTPKNGDVIITSGQDGVFPEGLPIGRVSKIVSESSLYKSVEVTPFQNFSSLNEVVFLLQIPGNENGSEASQSAARIK